MLKRLKRMWNLSQKDPEILNNLTEEQINQIPNVGDGKAVFIPQGSEEDFKEFEKEEKGFKGIFGS
jgi:Mg2+/Co2+ transporter CorB